MTSRVVAPSITGFALPDGLDTPSVVIDLDIVERNIATMAAEMRQRGVAIRPHAKTHKSVEIARRQLAAGAVGLTVGTIGEAEVMARAGFDDLFIAYPVWPGGTRAARLGDLLDAVVLTVGVESRESARALGAAIAGRQRRLRVLIEMDSGEDRTGVADPDAIAAVAEAACAAGLDVRGAFTHGGHGYASPDARLAAARDECSALAMAGETLAGMGLQVDTLSAGSTPTATLSAIGPVTEERPGTYVYGDRQQINLGSVEPDTAALMVAATVVSLGPDGRIVIDAGAKVLTRERPSFIEGLGEIPALGGALVERAYDYHGVARLPAGVPAPAIGTIVGVVPNHVCPVVNLVDAVTVVRHGKVIGTWPVDARGRNG